MPIYKKVNKDFFKKWTSEMAYVLGFFAADGYITVNKRGASFWSIQITDKDLLYKIRDCIESEHKISERVGKGNEKNLYRLQIGSYEMCADLNKLGYRQNKTKSLFLPNVPDKYFSHFVRGYFDGDGNVWMGYLHKNRPKPDLVIFTAFTSCSLDFLLALKDRLNVVGLIGGSVIKNKQNYCRLSFSTKNTLKLFKFMYNSIDLKKDGLFLKRKLAVFERFEKTRA
ncbi:MAG: LAGLIDADG family homing endonuclease [bacterium]